MAELRNKNSLTPTQERVFGYIAAQTCIGGGACCTKKEMALRMHCCERTIDRAIRELRAQGMIEVIPRFGEDGTQMGNAYRLSSR